MTEPELYLDHNASAPLLPEAREAVVAALAAGPGNPSSSHGAGRRLGRILGDAREHVARLVGAAPREVVFTSGATEANALGVLGLLEAAPGGLVTTEAEHESLLRLAEGFGRRGGAVRRAPVDPGGRFDAGEVLRLAREGVTVVSVTAAQGITGALQPVEDVAAGLAPAGVALHVDAAQAAGRVAARLPRGGPATMAVSGHKLGGPQGIGALIIADGTPWTHPFGEAAQELGRRPGTQAVALAAGFGAAARIAADDRERWAARAGALAALARPGILALAGAEDWSAAAPALPNTLLVAFAGCPGDAVLAALDQHGIRVSTGSACASGARVAPHVLVAGGREPSDAARAIRISFGREHDERDVERLVRALADVVSRVAAARRRVQKI